MLRQKKLKSLINKYRAIIFTFLQNYSRKLEEKLADSEFGLDEMNKIAVLFNKNLNDLLNLDEHLSKLILDYEKSQDSDDLLQSILQNPEAADTLSRLQIQISKILERNQEKM